MPSTSNGRGNVLSRLFGPLAMVIAILLLLLLLLLLIIIIIAVSITSSTNNNVNHATHTNSNHNRVVFHNIVYSHNIHSVITITTTSI